MPAGDGAAQAIQDLTQGRGADLTLDLVGNEATMALAMATTRAPDASCWWAWPAAPCLELLGHEVRSRAVGVDLGQHLDLREVIALAQSGLIAPTVTTYGFDDIPAAFDALESGTLEGRAVIPPNG